MGLLEYRSFGISGEDDDICIDLIEGMWQPVQVRGQDWVVPKLEGLIWGNRRRDRITFTLGGFIRGSGADPTARLEDFNANVQAVMTVMDPEAAPGDLVASQGYLGLATGDVATIEARVRNAAPGRIQSYGLYPFQLWTFELEAITDPVDWVIT